MTDAQSELQAVWATYPASWSTSQKLAALNGKVVPGPARDVPRAEITKILQTYGALGRMRDYVLDPSATQPCLMATNYLLALIEFEASITDTLATSVQSNLDMINSLVDGLLQDGRNGITADILAQVMTLITPSIPWWKANGFPGPILVSDLIAAGNLF